MTNDLEPGLYIIATPIGNIGDITLRALDILKKADVIICEDTRVTGKLTSAYGIGGRKVPYHDHNAAAMRPKILDMIRAGKRVALVSDAGTPLISDPGYKLVEDCIRENLFFTCAPGASAVLAGLTLAGLPTDRFLFAGFLPPKSGARRSALKELEDIQTTLVFYETAPRLIESLKDMQAVLGDRRTSVARELTKKFEEVRRGLLSELLDHYIEKGPPKGEIVILTEGAPDKSAAHDESDIEDALRRLLETLSVKDAAAALARETGLKKRDLYERALAIAGKKDA